MSVHNSISTRPHVSQLESAISALLKLIGPVEYGSIELTFHQGRIVQLEKREKTRFRDAVG